MVIKEESQMEVTMHYTYQDQIEGDEISIEEQGFMLGYKQAFKEREDERKRNFDNWI
jgi:hypothetical protein